MRTRERLFRCTALVTAGSLMLVPMVPQSALAQPAPPPGAATQQTGGDPPERVGRLARVTGTVSYHTTDDTQWSPATLNYPVTSGNAFWTEPNAEADIDISASRIVMAGGAEFDINTLDNATLQAILPQGEIYVHIRALAPNETYTLQTPRGQVSIAVPGRYGLVAGDTSNPTLVTVIEGSAQVSGPNLTLDVTANQTATITGIDNFAGSVGPVQQDAFLTAMLQRERPPPAQAVAPPPVVAQMTGSEDLNQYGTWSQAPEYGEVWYPQVASGWAPYRNGHWAYVAPWGWTWVDDAPWGFAPFHYGRWVDVGGRWGWTPGVASADAYTPVYAPALVTFFGVAAGVGIGVGIGAALANGSVGWCPLGWREPYHPWYHTSPAYVRNVNPHITNITTINRNVTINNFVNRNAATVAPASALAASQPIQRFGRQATPQALAQARPVIGQEPLRPTVATSGVTPAVAQRMHLAPSPAGLPAVAHAAAPGPAITAQPVAAVAGAKPPPPVLHNPAAAATPAAASVHPPLAGAAMPGAAAPGAVSQPGGAQHLPPLATPGGRPAAVGGAPGPAFTPHAGAGAAGAAGVPATGGLAVGTPAAAGLAAPHPGAVTGPRPPTPGGAPGPAITPYPGATSGTPAAAGVAAPHLGAPAMPGGAPGPTIMSHPGAGGTSGAPGPALVEHGAGAVTPATHGQPALHATPAMPAAVAPLAPHVAAPVVTPHPVTPAVITPSVQHPAVAAPVPHVAAPPPPVVHAAPVAPVAHAAPPPAPMVHAAPPPAPVVHAAPPPAPVVHAAPPPAPVVHTAPPPPAPHPAPAAAPAAQKKLPGQP